MNKKSKSKKTKIIITIQTHFRKFLFEKENFYVRSSVLRRFQLKIYTYLYYISIIPSILKSWIRRCMHQSGFRQPFDLVPRLVLDVGVNGVYSMELPLQSIIIYFKWFHFVRPCNLSRFQTFTPKCNIPVLVLFYKLHNLPTIKK